MALFTESEVRSRAEQEETFCNKSAAIILNESVTASLEQLQRYPSKQYDIFLSHSIKDAELILGIKKICEDLGYSVYVDWFEDGQLDRGNVTKHTADILRKRMLSSKSLFYVATENAEISKWMPWECGYFDGLKGKVAIVPIKKYSINNNEYTGQEYLGLYPYIVKEKARGNGDKLVVHLDRNTYVLYDDWVKTDNEEIEWRKI
jgi:hypothetical protein